MRAAAGVPVLGVFAAQSPDEISGSVRRRELSGAQLHGLLPGPCRRSGLTASKSGAW